MTQTIVISPSKLFSPNEVGVLWEYRELLYFLVWRNLKVRYKQTAIGILWAIFQPAISMVIFTLFFSRLIGPLTGNTPYSVFVYTGLVFWQLLSTSLTDVSESLIVNKDIITKVYFPRLMLPIAAVSTRFVDAIVASSLLFVLMFYYGIIPSIWSLLSFPLLLIFTAFTALGGGLLLAGLNVHYRDVRYVLPFFIQLTLFLTPVIYPAQTESVYSKFLVLNPLTGIVHAARASLFQTSSIPWIELEIAALLSLALLVTGYWYFRHVEQRAADIV